jgi:hypothetical protein
MRSNRLFFSGSTGLYVRPLFLTKLFIERISFVQYGDYSCSKGICAEPRRTSY